jgi:hypothetical protein
VVALTFVPELPVVVPWPVGLLVVGPCVLLVVVAPWGLLVVGPCGLLVVGPCSVPPAVEPLPVGWDADVEECPAGAEVLGAEEVVDVFFWF